MPELNTSFAPFASHQGSFRILYFDEIFPVVKNEKGVSGMYRLVLREADFLDITRSADIERSYILVYYGIIGDFVMNVFPEVIDCP